MARSGDPWRIVAPAAIAALGAIAIGCGRIITPVGTELAYEAAAPPDDAGTLDEALPEASTDGAPDAPACREDLSNIGTGDFHVALTLTTTQTDNLVALVNQRGTCGPSLFWDIRMDGGLLYVETDDVAHYTPFVSTGTKVNDGMPHAILLQRVAGQLEVLVDGAPSGSQPSATSFGALPPVRVKTDICDGQLEPNGVDRTAPLVGTISDLCVSAP
jgi:hypothetical protein